MAAMTPLVVHWYRRDLRVSDNSSLLAAEGTGLPVLPLYITSEWSGSHEWTGPKRQKFLCGCLSSLAANLDALGGRLIIRHGEALGAFRKLAEELKIVEIHFNRDPDPFGKKVEAGLEAWCRSAGIGCHGHDDYAMHCPDEVRTQTDSPYRVYTPYSKRWLALEKKIARGKPSDLRTPAEIHSEALPDLSHWDLQDDGAELPAAGERAARMRLKRALEERIVPYATRRDVPALAGTSRLSQDLRFGLLSIRTLYAEVMKLRKSQPASAVAGCDTFVKELAWREFYFSILHFFPNVLEEEFNPEWRGMTWSEPGRNWEAWTRGETGFPIVDAGIRELLKTGFMHNRVRMIVAMFLTKDLHVDWRHGEAFFMRHLIDGEIASNNGGWQWSAGTGADAAPYFRIQNPWSQSARHDPKGEYIKKWLPELEGVDPDRLAEPPRDGNPLAPGYPLPCVDHRVERDKALSRFKRHRERVR